MLILHPEYDHCWFVTLNDPSGKRRVVQAPTIRALLEKLGPGYKIKDYYPDGNTPVAHPKPVKALSERTLEIAYKIKHGISLVPEKIMPEYIAPEPPTPPPEPMMSKLQVRKGGRKAWTDEEWTQAQELYKSGYNYGQIADMLGKKRNSVIGKFYEHNRRLQELR